MIDTENRFLISGQNYSIKKNLSITFFILFLFPVIVISVFFIIFIYTTLDKNETNKIETSLKNTEQNFNYSLSIIQNFSDRLYVNRNLQNVLSRNYENIQEVYESYVTLKFLEDYLNTYSEISSYRIFSENDTLLDNQFIIKATQNIKNSTWYVRAKENNGHGQWLFMEDPVTKKSYLSFIRSLWNKEKTVCIGILKIDLDPAYVKNILKQSLYDSFIVMGQKIIYYSQEDLPTSAQNMLVNHYVSYNFDKNYIKHISIAGGEKVGIYGVNFVPDKANEIKFQIVYMVPVEQISIATKTTIIVSVIFISLIIVLSLAAVLYTGFYMDNRVSRIQNQIDKLIENNFDIEPTIGGNDEFEQVYHSIYKMSLNMKKLVKEVYQKNLEKELLAHEQSEISFKMLANQINPHFLFNTIETIRMKSIANGDKEVSSMLKMLASLLRYNLNVKNQTVVLADEIQAVQNYLTIQNIRFGERVTYDVVTMCDVDKIKILPLIIQPIVENSFVHGLENKLSGGFIYVLITNEIIDGKSFLQIKVQDNGSGIEAEKLNEIRKKLKVSEIQKSSSIGLFNVNSRIKMYYGNESGISIESEPGQGTTIIITVIQTEEK